MASKVIYPVVAFVGIAALSGAAWWYQNKSNPAKPDSPGVASGAPAAPAGGASAAGGGGSRPSVEVAKVEVARLVDDTQAVGSLRSRRGVMIRPEVSGRITQLQFRDGDRVRRGQLLVQLDDQLQQAQVLQAQAELSIARANNKRNQELVSQGFISQRSLDESLANQQVAEAKLALARATAARLKIVAPFDGIAGIRLVNVGDYLKDGADIVNIEDIQAVYVDYRLPERFQAKVKPGQPAGVDIDALPGRKFAATVQAIDPLIDANGRSVGIRGCIDNRQLQLRPGMFARVNTVFGVRENARVIPEEAIVPQGGRQFVIKLVDGPDGRLSQRTEVKVGLRMGGKVEISEGLEPGETVVISGQQRITKDGTSVRVVDLAAAPKPAGSASGPRPAASAAAAAVPAVEASKSTPGTSPSVAIANPTNPANAAEAGGRAAGKPATGRPDAAGPNPCTVEMAGVSNARSEPSVPRPAPDAAKPARKEGLEGSPASLPVARPA
ncbi:MAG: efflux RND transporter periplasmic adaptor subunit [Pseudomonadota bacterium]